MKKIFILGLATVIAAGTMQSCKKGENDPFFSLRSRKARIAGEWKLTSSKSSTVQDANGTHTTIATTYANGTETSTHTSTTGGNSITTTTTDNYTLGFEIKKDGTYKETYTSNGETSVVEGTWIFLKRSKENELKNKEAILLTQTSSTYAGSTTTTTGLDGQVYVIDQLKNKEMIWKTEFGQSDATGSETDSYEFVFTQK